MKEIISEYVLLRADVSNQDIKDLCEEAIQNNIEIVCVPPYFVSKAKLWLEESDVKISTVIGFPLGNNCIPTKVEEIKRALNDDVDIVHVLINISAVKNEEWGHLKNEMDSVSTAARLRGKKCILILETPLLNSSQIQKVCDLALSVGVDGVKDATGFNSDVYSEDIISLLNNKLSNLCIFAHQKYSYKGEYSYSEENKNLKISLIF